MGGTTINRVIERMGFLDGFTAHGFRATASTLLHEAGFDSRLIEMQLAHQGRNKSRASYDHSARLPERRQMMQSWANMLDKMMRPNSNVLSIRHRSASEFLSARLRRRPEAPVRSRTAAPTLFFADADLRTCHDCKIC